MKIDKQKTFSEIIETYGLSESQIEFYQSYSRQRSASCFEKQALKLVGDPELIKNWKYKGYYDTGARGKGKCSLGHKLRYVHLAYNDQTKETVKFGIKCVTDFFQLTPLALKLIRQGFNEANNEIKESLEKFIKFGSFESYNKTTDIINKMELVINNNPELLYRPYKDLFEETITIGEMMGFLTMKLPVPDWFEIRINNAYNKVNQKNKIYNTIYKNLALKTEAVLNDKNFENNHNEAYNIIKSIFEGLCKNLSISPKAKDLLEKLINFNWNKFDSIINDLIVLNRTDFKSNRDFDFVQNIAYTYNKYGLSEKQANIIEKIHAGYYTNKAAN